MRLLDRLVFSPASERGNLDEYLTWIDQSFGFGGFRYPLGGPNAQGPPGIPTEPPPGDFTSIVQQVYERNGIVAGCITARMSLISEARFKWRNLSDRKLYGDTALLPLERPTVNETAADILARLEQDASLGGNGYRFRIDGQLHRVSPAAVSIVLGSNMVDPAGNKYEVADAPDATVVGYAYWPKGKAGKYKPNIFLPSEVAHYAPEPDPLCKFRGASWLRQVLAEIDTDRQLTGHKAKFLEKGIPPFAIKYPEEATRGAGGDERAQQIIEGYRARQADAGRNWEALHLFGGADPVTLGIDFNQLDFKSIQGAGETRIAMRARVPAAVLGISEGLAGSALNSGNFGQARRQFGEQYAYPSWRQMCEALEGLVRVPPGAELWYDTTDVAFLREDAKDAADVIAVQATAIRTLIDGGMKADDAVKAVTGGDMSLLAGAHTGLVPVQLQPPGAGTLNTNGKAPVPVGAEGGN